MKLNKEDRQEVISALFDEMSKSAFCEGCQEKIVKGLEARTDEQLISLANKYHTWIPVEPVMDEPDWVEENNKI